jgi:hypothetical protein
LSADGYDHAPAQPTDGMVERRDAEPLARGEKAHDDALARELDG